MIAAMGKGTWLLAQMNRWSRLGDGLRSSRNPIEFSDVLPYALAAILLVVVIAIVNRRRQQNDMALPCDDPAKLFRELCQAHQIRGPLKRVLRQLAEAYFPQQPAQIFLTPSAFEVSALPESLQAEAAQFTQLRQRIFSPA